MTTAIASIDLTEAIDAAASLTRDAERARGLMRIGAISEPECLIRCLNATLAWGKTETTVANALDALADMADDARTTAMAAERASRDIRKPVEK